MSKDGGPPASSFTSPSKTGWLTKHGGHGIGANWKKRWFVLDNSYLFYYKGQNDKKPVGVICLHDYRSCRKAEQKESKKSPFTFVIEKKEDADDTSGRNYVIFGESEEDMTSWIRALKKEIQSSSPSASPALSPSPSLSSPRGKVKGKGKQLQPQKVKKAAAEVVDDKAFDELTLKVEEAPKLTHLTAERPRMRGRRPPRKYATFHEDDTKEDAEDEESPVKPAASSPSPPVSKPPMDSPSVSSKKGHHPVMPMKPKLRTATTSKNPSPPQSPKPSVAAKPSPPSIASKPSKTSLQGDEGESGSVKKQPPVPPTKPKSTSLLKQEEKEKKGEEKKGENAVHSGEGKKSPPVPPVKPKPTSSPSQDETAGEVAPQHEKHPISPGPPVKQTLTPILVQEAAEEEKEVQQLKSAPVPPAKPVPKKRVPRPSVDKGESEVHLSSPPPVLEETETAATNHSSQPEPLQEIPAEKKEEEKEKEMPQKANTTESQDDLAKPVSQPVSATPLKFNKPPAPRKPRGGQSATNTSHKPMPVPRPRTGSNISSKSDDQVEKMEETKKEILEEKEPIKEAAVVEHPKKDDNEEVEAKAKISDTPLAAATVTAAVVVATVVDQVVNESPLTDTASLDQTQEQKVEQTLDKEDTQQPTETEKKEKEEKQPEVVTKVPTEVAEESKDQVKEEKDVAISENGNALEEKSESSEETLKEKVSVDDAKKESTEVTRSIEDLKSTDPDITSPSRRIAYENVVLNVADDGKVLLCAQDKDRKETTEEEEKNEGKIEFDEEEEESVTEEKAATHTPDSISVHSTGAVSNHSQPLSPLSSDEYERMHPASRPAISTASIPPSPSISHASAEYEDMRNWGSNSSRQPSNTSSRQDYELVDSGALLSETANSNDSLYDIPRPTSSPNRAAQIHSSESRSSSGGSQMQGSLTPTRPASQQSKTIELGELSEEEAPDVPPFTGASGSVSSASSSTQHDRTLSTTSSLHGPPPERDALGYAKIYKKKDSDSEDPHGWLVEQAAAMEGQLPNTTAESLKQVREILRLARIAKMEAEEMKKEAERELELARRDRHDAGLLKKNAAEILKMAKERLHTK